jgi:hypothetical protein
MQRTATTVVRRRGRTPRRVAAPASLSSRSRRQMISSFSRTDHTEADAIGSPDDRPHCTGRPWPGGGRRRLELAGRRREVVGFRAGDSFNAPFASTDQLSPVHQFAVVQVLGRRHNTAATKSVPSDSWKQSSANSISGSASENGHTITRKRRLIGIGDLQRADTTVCVCSSVGCVSSTVPEECVEFEIEQSPCDINRTNSIA